MRTSPENRRVISVISMMRVRERLKIRQSTARYTNASVNANRFSSAPNVLGGIKRARERRDLARIVASLWERMALRLVESGAMVANHFWKDDAAN